MKDWHQYIVGCAIGNMMEWYDFILYGFFSSIIASLFFPHHDKFTGLLLTFTVFASGCFIRPFASLVFGHIGDTLGRKLAIIITIFFITLSTTAMGLLPTYETAGILAPILLVICRLLQGVAVSGEEMGVAVLLSETAKDNEQAFVGSVVIGTVNVGLFLGALSALAIFHFFKGAALMQYGWRIPFLASSILGVIALWARLKAIESPVFKSMSEKKQVLKSPVSYVLRYHVPQIIRGVCISAIFGVTAYLFAVYLPAYYVHDLGFAQSTSLKFSTISLFIMAIIIPLLGWYADKVGARRMMVVGCVGCVLFAYPVFSLLVKHSILSAVFADAMLMGCLACISASFLPQLMSLFPSNVKYSGVCIAYNIGMTLFGSTAPIIALQMQHTFHSRIAPFGYLIVVAVIAMLGVLVSDIKWHRLGFHQHIMVQQ
ncbi:MAG: MFS transporter [Gammaproteobacteria bacterium]